MKILDHRIVKGYININNSRWVEWLFRIAFTLIFVFTLTVECGEHYPEYCWAMILVAVWLYFFKWRIPAFIPLMYTVLFHYLHFS